jgi:DNA-binding Lrp family transcriptional regulator
MDVLIGIRIADESELSRISGALAGIDGVSSALELSGNLDILLRASSGSLAGMRGIIEKVKSTSGVREAKTYLIIGERR